MSRILYPDLSVDSIFLNPKQKVEFILIFFSEQLFLMHYLGALVLCYLSMNMWKVLAVTMCYFYINYIY